MSLPLQTFLLSDVTIAQTKHGKNYVRCRVGDKTGNLVAVFWDYETVPEQLQQLFKSGELIDLAGVIDTYHDKPQFKISGVSPASTSDQRDFEKSSKYEADVMWSDFMEYVRGFSHPWFNALADTIVKEFQDQFKSKPAATGMHHAFKHGLLEHTLQMLQTADKLFELPFYSEALNKDICLFGIMFHDFGKIFEYGDAPGFSKTISGIKVPHIPKMAAIIYEKSRKLGQPSEFTDEVMSIVLSHHRFLEWGSPCSPSSPEALFVHYVDNLHGDVFGTLQRIQDDTSGDDRVKHGFGKEAYTLSKKSFSTLMEELDGRSISRQNQDASTVQGQEGSLDGF